MLEITTIRWSNFLSYGDYENTLDLKALKQCLITGEIDKKLSGDQSTAHRSNGAGKSAALCALQWGLFGRTMHDASPGNSIINWYTKKPCMVQIDFTSGGFIRRSRTPGGQTELMYTRNGEETCVTAETLATAKLQQQQLNRDYGLDWELFCGSVFFSQYDKPWLEMADQTRKKALERLLHIDRFNYYAKVAQARSTEIDNTQQRLQLAISALQSEQTSLQTQVVELESAMASWQQSQADKLSGLKTKIVEHEAAIAELQLPDLQRLQDKWAIIGQIRNSIIQYQSNQGDIQRQISAIQERIRLLNSQISMWNSKSGKVCGECRQTITSDHSGQQCSPLSAQITTAKEQLEELQKNSVELATKITTISELLKSKQPSMDIATANGLHQQAKLHRQSILGLQDDISRFRIDNNPYQQQLERVNQRLLTIVGQIVDHQKSIERYSILINHTGYIQNAYQKRTAIKSLVTGSHIEFINQRLRHYLELLDLDIIIKITDNLGMESNLWGYKYESGGERTRTSIAMMLATYDFHDFIYGRQSNLIVLDEVDSKLDDHGVEVLTQIIANELAPRTDCILVISHKNYMRDILPHEIKVKRNNRFSYLEQVC